MQSWNRDFHPALLTLGVKKIRLAETQMAQSEDTVEVGRCVPDYFSHSKPEDTT